MKYTSKLIASTLAGAAILAGPATIAQQQSSSSMTGSQMRSSLTGEQPVSLDKVPTAAKEAIHSQAGQASVSSVSKATFKGTAYQAQYEKNGKPVYLQVSENGTILNKSTVRTVKTPLENPTTATFDQLPPQVQNTITSAAGSAQISSLTKGTWHGTVYEAKLSTPGAKEILVTSDGTVLKPGAMKEAAGATTTAAGTTKAFKELPWTVQKPMLEHSGNAKITTVTETKLPDGRMAYMGTYTKSGQQHQITVDQSGAVVSDKATGTAPTQ